MTEKNQIYKCEVCGNIIEVINIGSGTLVCCGQDMILLETKTKDEGMEKHVPTIKQTEKGFKVRVGKIEHPMEENHYIEWIELLADGKLYRQSLAPQDKPETEFCINAKKVSAREHCNIHGLWESKQGKK